MRACCNFLLFPGIFFLIISGCREIPGTDAGRADTAVPWAFSHFEKTDSLNPILNPSADLQFTDPVSRSLVSWEERNVLNPTAVVRNNQVYLLYRAQDKTGTSRIGMAVSEDGLHFKKIPEPVFYPDRDFMKKFEWNYKKVPDWKPGRGGVNQDYFDGVEDPRIAETEAGEYIMTYTAYDGRTARLCFATSGDLSHWEKKGPVLQDTQYADTWSKSGAILCERNGNRMIARKINGKYWMYFGDTDIFMAGSDDLVHWEPLVNEESGKLFSVLCPRPGYFDSRLVEPGPYALLKEQGILLIYNGSNAATANDTALPAFTYAAGQALFDRNLPYKLIGRTDSYFIYPDKDYEKVGEVNEVCFVEGLVYFRNKWLLYYGTADSRIAVAVYENQPN